MYKKTFKGKGSDELKAIGVEELNDGGANVFISNDPEFIATEISITELKISPTFKELIPPLSQEEYNQLEENLIENGIREAISLWNGFIIDGHNRYEIAQKHNLSYATVSYKFDNEDDVKLWIFKNQIARRNLSALERVILALHLKPVIAEKAKEQQIRKSAKFVPQISAEQKSIDTRKVIADMAGVSHDTVSKIEKILDAGTLEMRGKINNGDITINKAYQEIKRRENRQAITESAIQPKPFINLDSKYDVILCDWESEFSESSSKSLEALEIPSADNAILFMWATAPVLKKAMKIMSVWGFEYRTCAVWDKLVASLGQYLRNQHELLLIGIKGKYPTPSSDVQACSLYSEKIGKHSKKPEYYYKMIEDMCPNGAYLELFANKKHSSKWTVWSNHMSEEEQK